MLVPGGPTKIRTLILLGVAAAFVSSCADSAPRARPSPGTPAATPTEEPTEEDTTTPQPPRCKDATLGGPVATIRLVDHAFRPACLSVLGGQSLRLANRGQALHNFTVEGTSVDMDVEPGASASTEPIGTAVEAGEHVFFCSYHRGQGMEGTLTVTAAG